MTSSAESNYAHWLASMKVSSEDKLLLRKLTNEAIADAFGSELQFSRGGFSARMGSGNNRLNEFTLKKIVIAYASALSESFPDAKSRGVILAHDNRRYARNFTLLNARILNTMGFKVYLYDALRPAPELSFTLRSLHAIGGVYVGGGLLPPDASGVQLYDETGALLSLEKAERFLGLYASLPDVLSLEAKPVPFKGSSVLLDYASAVTYLKSLESDQLNPSVSKSFSLVFSPLYGTTYENAARLFKECGYLFFPVEKQCTHDPDFGGIGAPDPQKEAAFQESLSLARSIQAPLIGLVSPDGRGFGVAYRKKDGSYEILPSETKLLFLAAYLFRERKAHARLKSNGLIYAPENGFKRVDDLARSYGLEVVTFPSASHSVGDCISGEEETGKATRFEFGYETNGDCLLTSSLRDEGGLAALLLFSEAVAWLEKQGRSVEEECAALLAR